MCSLFSTYAFQSQTFVKTVMWASQKLEEGSPKQQEGTVSWL